MRTSSSHQAPVSWAHRNPTVLWHPGESVIVNISRLYKSDCCLCLSRRAILRGLAGQLQTWDRDTSKAIAADSAAMLSWFSFATPYPVSLMTASTAVRCHLQLVTQWLSLRYSLDASSACVAGLLPADQRATPACCAYQRPSSQDLVILSLWLLVTARKSIVISPLSTGSQVFCFL
jgi:hypothetical protein